MEGFKVLHHLFSNKECPHSLGFRTDCRRFRRFFLHIYLPIRQRFSPVLYSEKLKQTTRGHLLKPLQNKAPFYAAAKTIYYQTSTKTARHLQTPPTVHKRPTSASIGSRCATSQNTMSKTRRLNQKVTRFRQMITETMTELFIITIFFALSINKWWKSLNVCIPYRKREDSILEAKSYSFRPDSSLATLSAPALFIWPLVNQGPFIAKRVLESTEI